MLMKMSREVPATLIAAIAAAMLTGCSSPREVRRCLDKEGRVIADQYCENPSRYPYRSGGIVFIPSFGYGGSFSGGRVRGYNRAPSGNADVVTSSGRVISRGGFGSSGSSSSGSTFGG